MIKYEARYFANAHRMSDIPVAPVVGELHDGQWMQFDAEGRAVISDGAVNKKSYITTSSRWGNPANMIGQPINAGKNGRDTVTSTGTVALLTGPFRLETDQFVPGETYLPGGALKVYDGADAESQGKLVPVDGVADSAEVSKIVAYVWKAPNGGFLGIVSA